MLLGAPKLPDFHRVARFGPGYHQKLPTLTFLTNLWQKSVKNLEKNYFHRVARIKP